MYVASNNSSFHVGTTHAAVSPAHRGAVLVAAARTKATQRATVTLTFIKIADPLEAKAFAEMVQAFHKIDGGKWSYVNIQYDAKPFAQLFPAIETSVATGATVDIIQADGPDVQHFAWNGVIKDLTPYFSKRDLAQWDAGSNREGTYKGHFYGPAESQSCQLLWYNKDMAQAAGIKFGLQGLTYGPNGTALPVFQKLTQAKNGSSTPTVFGFQNGGPDVAWSDYFEHIPARTNSKPGSRTFEGVSPGGTKFVGYFDTPQAIQAYQFDQDLITKYHVRSSEASTSNAIFAGQVATTISQDLILGTLHDQFPNFKLGVTEPPYWITPMCQTGSWHYAISANTHHFQEALAFIKYASSDAGASFIWKYKNQMPANVKLFNSLPDYRPPQQRALMKTFFQRYGQPRIVTPAYTEYNALFGQFYSGLVAGGHVADLAHQYAQQMQQAAAKYGSS
jgi:ABC-type glycerol-3-phosphate transport system substrate-binding protein